MSEFIKLFDEITNRKNHRHWRLEIYYSSVIDWNITITDRDTDKQIISVQNCDADYVFAKAQIELKEWLLENEGGY